MVLLLSERIYKGTCLARKSTLLHCLHAFCCFLFFLFFFFKKVEQ